MAKDRLVTFYEPVQVKSSSGAMTTTYRALELQAWAEVKWDLRGGEKSEGKQTVATSGISLTIWYRTDLRAHFLFLLEGIYYDIHRITEGRSRRLETLIEATAKDNDWNIPLYTP